MTDAKAAKDTAEQVLLLTEEARFVRLEANRQLTELSKGSIGS
jgi:hypothetical protein